jgi:DNA sulfur modification protein DndD
VRYREITFENFRLFRGIQTVTLPDQDGVVVLYALNGRGKTSFLNGLRWAWTGVARGRNNRKVALSRLPNRDAIEDATGAPVVCRVQLKFDAGGIAWDLARSLTTSGDSVTTSLTLLRDGVALTASDAARTVAEMMPADIEQFFLFDGELLDQYERLVDDDSPAGSPLRDAIERILGVPVVVNAARDMRAQAEQAGKAIADAAKREARTREIGQALQTAQELASEHRTNAETEDQLIRTLEAEYRELDEQMAEQQNKLDLKARRDAKREELARQIARRDEAREHLTAALGEAWRAVLVEPISDALLARERELEADRQRHADAVVSLRLTEAYQATGQTNCPVCMSGLDDTHRKHLLRFVGDADGDQTQRLSQQVQQASQRVATLRQILNESVRAEIRTLESGYRRADVDVNDIGDDLRQLEEQYNDTPDDQLTDLITSVRNVTLRLDRARGTYTSERSHYEEALATIDRLQDQLKRMGAGGADAPTLAREQLTRDLATLFEGAVVEYRERLKEQVQETASKLFRNMRQETEFYKLVINDQYGLRILDSQGRAVDDRSAGYEHLVALCLIGALQECSPVGGPIVMDSPFGRLDPQHVKGVVGQLNALADQVLLLVHEGELDPITAREQLRGRLLAEYELRRVSAFHSEIKEVRS